MHQILTVTLNPALDIATSIDHVVPAHKLRCAPPQSDPGGGGLNVARAIHQLGGQATAFVALGGDTGHAVRHLLEDAALPLIVHPAPGDTRQSLAVTDLSLGEQFRFMLPGPDWSTADIARVHEAILEAAPQDGFVVLSGSGPSGARPDLYARLAADLRAHGTRVIIDTSGPTLAVVALGSATPPFVLRMDQAEAESLTRHALPHREDTAAFAQKLVAQGAADVVIIARGADGNVLATIDERWFCAAAKVEVKSKVGAGDSFVGAFTMAVAQNLDLPTALAHGAAAASAACMTEGTQLCLRADFDACLKQSVPVPL